MHCVQRIAANAIPTCPWGHIPRPLPRGCLYTVDYTWGSPVFVKVCE
nr:MAG TPA: hypothetical protein [Caudoviricetes sp.]